MYVCMSVCTFVCDLLLLPVADSHVIMQAFVHVVWAIGEYASSAVDARCTPAVLLEFHEVFVHLERLLSLDMRADSRQSRVRGEHCAPSAGSRRVQGPHGTIWPPSPHTMQGTNTTRLMCAIMASLAKVASRHQELVSLVQLCLTKVSRRSLYPSTYSLEIIKQQSENKLLDKER